MLTLQFCIAVSLDLHFLVVKVIYIIFRSQSYLDGSFPLLISYSHRVCPLKSNIGLTKGRQRFSPLAWSVTFTLPKAFPNPKLLGMILAQLLP